MAEVAIHDGPAPTASSSQNPDAPPSSAGSAGHSGAVEPAHLPVLSDELKDRLDKVIYSDVCCRSGLPLGLADMDANLCRSVL